MDKESLRFCAKYPFTEKAKQVLKDFNLDEVEQEFLEETERRITAAITNSDDPKKHYRMIQNAWETTLIKEIVTYPLIKITAAQTHDHYIKQKTAANEAKKTKYYLNQEKTDRIEEIAGETLEIQETDQTQRPYKIPMHEYLQKQPQGKNNKLINQPLDKGYIYLDKNQLGEIISSHVYNELKNQEPLENPPENIKDIAEQLKKKRTTRYSTSPQQYGDTEIDAFPPCMKKVYDDLASGKDVGHQPRFVLATFMVNIGMNMEEMLKPFQGQPEYDEEKTRYHLQHAAGKKGGGTRYKCPSCSKIKTYGLCIADCNVKHPLSYYKKQKKNTKKDKNE